MNILIVVAHPNADSFNHALLDNIANGLEESGHTPLIKDLYSDRFNPVLTDEELNQVKTGVTPARILTEQEDVLWADSLIFIYPLWWFGPPAILKGWFDSVLSYDFAFKQHDGALTGLLTHSKAWVLITAGSDEDWFKARDAETIIFRPVTEGTLNFCGVSDINCEVFYNLTEKSDQERADILFRVYKLGKDWDLAVSTAPQNNKENGSDRPLISQVF